MKSDIPPDGVARAYARLEPLLETLRDETNKLGPEDDSALVYLPDEAPAK